MAKNFVCAVFDHAAQIYARPLFVPSSGLAVRWFMDEVSRKADENPMCRHPDDFELHLLGYWDDNSGKFDPVNESTDVLLMRGKDVYKE